MTDPAQVVDGLPREHPKGRLGRSRRYEACAALKVAEPILWRVVTLGRSRSVCWPREALLLQPAHRSYGLSSLRQWRLECPLPQTSRRRVMEQNRIVNLLDIRAARRAMGACARAFSDAEIPVAMTPVAPKWPSRLKPSRLKPSPSQTRYDAGQS